MGKKKHEKKSAPKLSKKELKKAAAKREAKIDEREKKAAKKALKHSDKVIAAEKAEKKKAAKPKLDPAVAERAKPLKGKELKAALEADTAAAQVRKAEIAADIDAQIAARVAKKAADQPGSEERLAQMQKTVAEDRAARHADVELVSAGVTTDAGAAADETIREVVAKTKDRKAAIERIAAQAETKEVTVDGTKVAESTHIDIAPAETAPAAPVEFASPSDAQVVSLEEGRNGYKIIQLGADGKPDPKRIRQMTRVTTFVGNIDDETTLKEWAMRLLAEGLAKNALEPREALPFITEINDIVHRRDVAIAKAWKADRKGKLGIGEVGHLIADAEKIAKDRLNEIVAEASDLAGRFDKADAGTHLHSLTEINDTEGIDAVRALHESGGTVPHAKSGEPWPVTATDLASIEAYDVRMRRLNAKVLYLEAVIVNDELGYAGRTDRIIMARLPEIVFHKGKPNEWTRPADARARRYVMDVKSGRVDYGAGKIARQLAAYALGKLYDMGTGERTSHSAARDVALVFHLPLGEGTCTVYPVDLKAGVELLKLSAEVRRARNTGRVAIEYIDIADAPAE